MEECFWRRCSKEAREIAETLKTSPAKRDMLVIAAAYAHLARFARMRRRSASMVNSTVRGNLSRELSLSPSTVRLRRFPPAAGAPSKLTVECSFPRGGQNYMQQ